MITIVNYAAEHLDRMDMQEAQQYLKVYLSPELREALASEHAYTALDGDEVLACGGLVPLWSNRAAAWAYLSSKLGPRRFVVIDRAVRRFLEAAPFNRIEATADSDFPQAHRWLESLGFELEAPRMRKHRPDGGDSAQYARVRV